MLTDDTLGTLQTLDSAQSDLAPPLPPSGSSLFPSVNPSHIKLYIVFSCAVAAARYANAVIGLSPAGGWIRPKKKKFPVDFTFIQLAFDLVFLPCMCGCRSVPTCSPP